MSAVRKKPAAEPTYPISQTDVTVLYGLMRAMVKHDRKLATLHEIYPFCLQDPRNVRWVMSRLKNRFGLVATQRVHGVGIMWVWCGKKSLKNYLIETLEDPNLLRSRPEKSHRMVPIKEMLKVLRKIEHEPRSKTVHIRSEAA